MRSHVTIAPASRQRATVSFQYRKRYEVTCDLAYHMGDTVDDGGFNTASGMRSHVTTNIDTLHNSITEFQYRKRYEVTCDRPQFVF